MPEIRKLPTASLRAPNRHPSSVSNRNIHRETMPNSRSAEFDTMQQDTTGRNENSYPRVRTRAWEATAFRFLSLGTDCALGASDFWSCRPRSVMPIDRTKPLEQNR